MKIFFSAFMTILLWTNAGAALAESADKTDCSGEKKNQVLEAARNGKLDTLKAYVGAHCVLPVADKRKFSLYDIAALNGDQEMMQWLSDRQYVHREQYSPAMIKLLQTGLRFLNFDAGVIDGRLNEATKLGISDFQKTNGFRVSGKVSSDWLPAFMTKIIKKMQVKLGALGFTAGIADGIIGPNTTSAMQAFRLERNMPEADYPHIDDQLIYQLMMAENDARKLEIAKREAARAARLVAQQAAQREAEARRRELARRQAAEKRRQAEAAAKRERAQQERDRQKAQRVEVKILTEQERIALLQREAAEKKRRAEEAQLQQQIEATKQAELAAQIEAQAQAQAQAAQKAAAEAKAQAREAFRAARSGKTVKLSPDVQVGKPIVGNKQGQTSASAGGTNFNQLTGHLKFVRSDGKLSQCLLGDRSIDIAWCEPYYPSAENKQCEAIVSQTGIVVSLLCH